MTVETKTYRDHYHHLEDELKRLNLLLHLAVLRFRKGDFNKYRGLLISEEEVNKVLDSFNASQKSNEPGVQQRLVSQIGQLQTWITERMVNSLKEGIFLPLYQLSTIFHLTPFEFDTILICLAPELDLKYERIYAYLHDDVTKKRPTVGLVLDLLFHSREEKLQDRAYFSPNAPLFRYGLLEFHEELQGGQGSILSKFLKINERMVNFVTGFNRIDPRISPFTGIVQPKIKWADIIFHEQLKERIGFVTKKYLSDKKEAGKRLVYHFFGPYGSGKKSVAEAICQELVLPLVIINLKKMLCEEIPFKKALQISFREAVLQPAAIYLDHFDHLLAEDDKSMNYQDMVVDTIEEYSWLTFLSTEREFHPQGAFKEHLFVNIEFPYLSYEQRHNLWQLCLNGQDGSLTEIDISTIANKFRFTPGQIKDAVVKAKNIALMGGRNNGQITMDDLYQGSRVQSNQKLSSMAQKITPHYQWQDIILPEDKLQQLKEICNCIKYRHLVYGEWGFDRKLSLGKGMNILFAGPSGTGKTMAAEIIAMELNIDLYKIDLSTVISKYIGETEKNLSKIFKEAETSNAILFFDEADALFGKRSEVHDSHDRYANIEIAYLLQKMEEYNGINILATNLSRHIDEAFLRRMHFSIEFPFPDEGYRYRIWESIFPEEAPKGDDIDFTFLSQNFKIAGGNIKNIILYAAFLAAEDGRLIRMNHIIQATKREFQKIGKLCVQSEFGKYYELVR